jgi:hypothetical protein
MDADSKSNQKFKDELFIVGVEQLKAIKHWYETSDSPYAIIMEDDCNLDLVRFWNFNWNDFYAIGSDSESDEV